MVPKLYTDAGNPQSLKLFIAARLSNKNIEVVVTKSEVQVVPYLTRKYLPVLKLDNDGDFLFSANAATRYLLCGDAAPSKDDVGIDAQIDTWLEWEFSQLQAATINLTSLSAGTTSKKEDIDCCLAALRPHLKYIEEKLKESDNNLVKGQMTAADVIVWATLYPVLSQEQLVKGWETDYLKVSSWFKHLSSKKEFQDGINQVTDGKGMSLTITGIQCKSNEKPLKGTNTAKNVPNAKKPSEKVHKKTPEIEVNKKSSPKPAAGEDDQESQADVVVNSEEISSAMTAWHSPITVTTLKREHPILPKPGCRNIIVTSALPYVNNVPHLGNIIGSTLSADVFSRYCRLRGYNSVYICGTDEYGTATETKAIEEGVTPQQVCDKYHKIHKEIYDWFQISFDIFGRTSTTQQTEISQSIFCQLHKNGYIFEDTVDQLKCEKCDRFLADRFVEGSCPLCGYDDARGDQCDKCGKLINAMDLVKPRCKTCSNTPVIRSSRHVFLDLPKLQPDVKKYLDKTYPKGVWTNNSKVITNAWLRDGLKPRCISRDLKWGTPIPLEGFTDKVFYVWFDAPIGYLSITANYTDKWESWWKNHSQVQLYHFLGKDNIPFHSVMFPCTLLGTGDNFTMVDSMLATEYLNYEDCKFSKSRGIGLFGDGAKDTGIPADAFRFYLLYVRPESQDTAFLWDDFQLKNNSELLNNIGNFINRALMFINNSFEQTIQPMNLIKEDEVLIAQMNKLLHRYIENMEVTKMRDSIRNLLSMSRLGNQFMQANKPWVLVKGSPEEKQRSGTVVSLLANIAALLSVLLEPFMPQTSATIQSQLQFPADKNVILENFSCYLAAGHHIGTPKPLFQKLENSLIQELKNKFYSEAARKAAKEAKAAATQPPAAAPAQPAAAQPPAAAPAPPTAAQPSDADVEKLTQLVTEQGLKVRELKTNKAEKAAIDAEVAKLLDLKRQLALKQGIDPATLVGGGKKKGKKK